MEEVKQTLSTVLACGLYLCERGLSDAGVAVPSSGISDSELMAALALMNKAGKSKGGYSLESLPRLWHFEYHNLVTSAHQ